MRVSMRLSDQTTWHQISSGPMLVVGVGDTYVDVISFYPSLDEYGDD
jgi:hypothetical protein